MDASPECRGFFDFDPWGISSVRAVAPVVPGLETNTAEGSTAPGFEGDKVAFDEEALGRVKIDVEEEAPGAVFFLFFDFLDLLPEADAAGGGGASLGVAEEASSSPPSPIGGEVPALPLEAGEQPQHQNLREQLAPM